MSAPKSPAWFIADIDQLGAACDAHDGEGAGQVIDRIYNRDPLLGQVVVDRLLDIGLPRLVDQALAPDDDGLDL